MNDLVDRLRGRARGHRIGGPKQMAVMLDEAAARIEQLESAGDKARARGDLMRMALEDIAYPNPLHNEDDLMRIARAALTTQEKQDD